MKEKTYSIHNSRKLHSCVVIVLRYKRQERDKQHRRLLHIPEKITFTLLKKVKINNE
jgi:hypothetical protein